MKVTRITHAMTLLQFGRTKVLTDPWIADRPGWRHSEACPADPDALAEVDVVICSHGHPDHFDLRSLRDLCPPHVAVLVRKGTGQRARAMGFQQVTELVEWEQAQPVPGLRITAAPARHSAPENTYIIESEGCTVFFGGDTRLGPAFAEVAHRYPRIDVALLPVNGVRLFGVQTVMDPAEAMEACRVLRPHVVIPIHYGMAGGWKSCWMLRQPGRPEEFQHLMQRSELATQVRILAPGETLTFGGGGNRAEFTSTQMVHSDSSV